MSIKVWQFKVRSVQRKLIFKGSACDHKKQNDTKITDGKLSVHS